MKEPRLSDTGLSTWVSQTSGGNFPHGDRSHGPLRGMTIGENHGEKLPIFIWLWVKTNGTILGVGAPPILVILVILVGIGMFTQGTGF